VPDPIEPELDPVLPALVPDPSDPELEPVLPALVPDSVDPVPVLELPLVPLPDDVPEEPVPDAMPEEPDDIPDEPVPVDPEFVVLLALRSAQPVLLPVPDELPVPLCALAVTSEPARNIAESAGSNAVFIFMFWSPVELQPLFPIRRARKTFLRATADPRSTLKPESHCYDVDARTAPAGRLDLAF